MSTTPERRRIGREARDAPTSGWLDVAWRVKDDVTADSVSMIAAGAAFFEPPRAPPAIAGGLIVNGGIEGEREPRSLLHAA